MSKHLSLKFKKNPKLNHFQSSKRYGRPSIDTHIAMKDHFLKNKK